MSADIGTVLQRDVRDIAHIDGLTAMPRLLAMLATRSPSLRTFPDYRYPPEHVETLYGPV